MCPVLCGCRVLLQRPEWSAVRWLLVDGVSGEVLQVGDGGYCWAGGGAIQAAGVMQEFKVHTVSCTRQLDV